MSVGERGRAATVENALSFCGQFGLSRHNALMTVNEVLEKTAKWREHFSDCGISEKEIHLLEPSFRRG